MADPKLTPAKICTCCQPGRIVWHGPRGWKHTDHTKAVRDVRVLHLEGSTGVRCGAHKNEGAGELQKTTNPEWVTCARCRRCE